MMNKLKSARLHLVRFLFILPLMAVLLVSFRNNYKHMFPSPGGGDIFINETGIVADYSGYGPLEGVKVVDKESGISTTTDARGFYQLHIRVTKDTMMIRTDFYKEGYADKWIVQDFPAVKETMGMIGNGILVRKTEKGPMMDIPYMGEQPGKEPAYEDALREMLWTITQQNGLKAYVDVRTAHPEVELFYTTEDRGKEIIILKDGEVERYGYPGGKTLADMNAKYGSMKNMGPQETPVTTGYLSNWQKISVEAERLFHTANPSVRHIIFPGDSRVIVVPVSGKPEIYDMDNDDPKERSGFEKLYGPLPDCVPAPRLHTHTGKG